MTTQTVQSLITIAEETKCSARDLGKWELIPYQTQKNIDEGTVTVSEGRRMMNYLYLKVNGAPDINLWSDVLMFDNASRVDSLNHLKPGDIGYTMFERIHLLFEANSLPQKCRMNVGGYFVYLGRYRDVDLPVLGEKTDNMVLYFQGKEHSFVVSSFEYMIEQMTISVLSDIKSYLKSHPEDRELFRGFKRNLHIWNVRSMHDYDEKQLIKHCATEVHEEFSDLIIVPANFFTAAKLYCEENQEEYQNCCELYFRTECPLNQLEFFCSKAFEQSPKSKKKFPSGKPEKKYWSNKHLTNGSVRIKKTYQNRPGR